MSSRYVDEEGVVTLKGRVAASIQSSDELVLTELIFNSGFKARPCRNLHALELRMMLCMHEHCQLSRANLSLGQFCPHCQEPGHRVRTGH